MATDQAPLECDVCSSSRVVASFDGLMKCKECGHFFEVDEVVEARERPVKRFDDDDRY